MSAEFNWFPGHMNKTLKEIEKRISIVDLVIEILDARIPYSSQNQTFRKVLKTKPVLYVLSKTDVADPLTTKKWIQHYKRKDQPIFVLNHNDRNLAQQLINAINAATAIKQKRDQEKGIVHPLINALVIGIPNVGKSTFINRLVKDKSVKVGNKPGVTRGIQLIQLNQYISLMDTPGVLPSKIDSELTAAKLCGINSIKENIFPRERVAAVLMRYIFNNYPELIENTYHLEDLKMKQLKRPINDIDTYTIFDQIAKVRGTSLKSNVLVIERVMEQFMRDIADGKLRVSLETPNSIQH